MMAAIGAVTVCEEISLALLFWWRRGMEAFTYSWIEHRPASLQTRRHFVSGATFMGISEVVKLGLRPGSRKG